MTIGLKAAPSEGNVLVLPAASKPSINNLISLDPKILFIILDIDAPIVSVYFKTTNVEVDTSSAGDVAGCRRLVGCGRGCFGGGLGCRVDVFARGTVSGSSF